MITEKHKQKKPTEEDIVADNTTVVTSEYDGNPMVDIYRAIETILKGIHVNPDDDTSPLLFKTVKLNTGQLTRIKNDNYNYEGALAFPAAFVHLINVRWLVSTSRIGEGRADLRICYVLNRLNNGDDDFQTEGFEVFQAINTALNNNKSKFSALTERLQLTYWDQVENFEDGLQQFWITYEVYFRDYSSYRYKNYVNRHIVIPPFTNHSDQNPECNPENHPNHKVNIEDVATLVTTESNDE
jgi:hypothetical protein